MKFCFGSKLSRDPAKFLLKYLLKNLGKNNIDDGETLNIKMLPCKNHKNVVHTKLYRSPSAEVCPPKPARAGG